MREQTSIRRIHRHSLRYSNRDNSQTNDLHPKATYTRQPQKLSEHHVLGGAFVVFPGQGLPAVEDDYICAGLRTTNLAASNQLLNFQRLGFFRRRNSLRWIS